MRRKKKVTPYPENRQLASLKPHPKQAFVFGDISEIELKALAADINKNGLRQPVEITSKGKIISGHQRVAAARLLEWTEIPCIVRADLEQLGEAAIDEHFINENLVRRQLSRLGIARCYLTLKEAYLSEGRNRQKHEIKRDVRDLFSEQFGVTGRTLDRYALILTTPIEVQNAFDQGVLSQAEAIKIATATEETQQQVAAALAAGEDWRPLIKEVKTNKNPRQTLERLLAALKNLLDKQQADGLVAEYCRPPELCFLRCAAADLARIVEEVDADRKRKPTD